MGLDGVALCGVRVELADVLRQLVEVFDGHPMCSSEVCLDGRFSFIYRKEFCGRRQVRFWVVALRFFRCIPVLGCGALLCSAEVRLSDVSLALALVSAHKHVSVLF